MLSCDTAPIEYGTEHSRFLYFYAEYFTRSRSIIYRKRR